MLNKMKKKFIAFFEGYFVELLKQQNVAKEELLQNCERIEKLEKDLAQAKTELNTQIVTTESNLNYYGMIRSITDENTYVGHELNLLALQKTSDPKILIAGFYGADNFGDEIMLQTLLSAIPEEMLSSVTVMLCDNADYDYFHLPGVNFIHIPKKTFECNLLAQYFDVLLWGGGALIDDGYYDLGPMELNNLYLALSERFIAFKKKVISLCLSANRELTHPEYCRRLKSVVENSTYFSLRDTNSMAVLKGIGIEKVDFLDDPVFFHKIWEKQISQKHPETPPTVGVIWICCEETEMLLMRYLEKIRNTYGAECKIRLIPFYNYVQADKAFYTALLEKLGEEGNTSVAPYTNRIDQMLDEIASCDYMINMRYHGMLLSGLLGKPSVNICYDIHRHYENKICYLADAMQIKESVVKYSEQKQDPETVSLAFAKPKRCIAEMIKPLQMLTDLIISKIE